MNAKLSRNSFKSSWIFIVLSLHTFFFFFNCEREKNILKHKCYACYCFLVCWKNKNTLGPVGYGYSKKQFILIIPLLQRINTKSYKISTTHSRILWQIHSQTYNCNFMFHLRNLTFTHPDKVRKKSLFILTLKQRLLHWQFTIILMKKKWLSNFRVFSQLLSFIHFLLLFICLFSSRASVKKSYFIEGEGKDY